MVSSHPGSSSCPSLSPRAEHRENPTKAPVEEGGVGREREGGGRPEKDSLKV